MVNCRACLELSRSAIGGCNQYLFMFCAFGPILPLVLTRLVASLEGLIWLWRH